MRLLASARRCAVGAIMVAALVAVVSTAQAEPTKIRMGWVATPASLVPFLFAHEGVAKHNGISYSVEAIHFQGSPLQITAIQSGDLDVAALGFSSFGLAVENAGISDLRIIADETQWGVPGYGDALFAVQKEAPIQKVEDLKDKVLVTNGIGGGLDMIMKAMMLKHGMIDKRDFSVIEVNFSNMKSVLLEKKADLVPFVLPWSRDPEFKSNSRVLFSTADSMGRVALSFWTARQGFLDKNRAAVVDLLEDYVRIIRWFHDPANHAEAVKIVSDFMKLPPAVIDQWVFTKDDYFRDSSGIAPIDAVTSNIHAQQQLGLIKADLDARQYDGLSLVKEAAARIK